VVLPRLSVTVQLASTKPVRDEFIVIAPDAGEATVARADIGKPVYWRLSDVVTGDKVRCL
jgi:hypothetical protein